MNSPVSPAVRVTTVIAVTVVALIAAVVSYSHMADLAHDAGEEWRSYLIPLSIDGLVVAASMVLLTRHRNGLPGGRLAWGALGAGVVASLAANMADARPEVVAVLVAGWPAAAFAVAFELLLQQRRAYPGVTAASEVLSPTGGPTAPQPTPLPVAPTQPWVRSTPLRVVPPVAPEPVAVPPVTPPGSPLHPEPVGTPDATPSPSGSAPVPSRVSGGSSSGFDDRDLVEQVRRLVADAHGEGQTVGRRAVAKQLNVSEHRARALLDVVSTTGPVLNGTSGTGKRAGHQSGGR